eukprot:4346470-Pyramimonas_sp.AAC.1
MRAGRLDQGHARSGDAGRGSSVERRSGTAAEHEGATRTGGVKSRLRHLPVSLHPCTACPAVRPPF